MEWIIIVFLSIALIAGERNRRFIFFGSSTPKLEMYNVDKKYISVSGISSGAAFATQYHVIYSKHIMGAGIIAGAPFICSEGVAATAFGACMLTPALVVPSALETITGSGALVGNIDATSNMQNDKVYIFNGKLDTVLNPGIGLKTQQYYQHYITNKSNIKTVFDVPAQHCMPTDNYGGPCPQLRLSDFINNCNYNAAYDLLNHIYGGSLIKPDNSTVASGKLMKFDQGHFFLLPPSTYSMDDIGYVYVPTRCSDTSRSDGCRLHIAFHGCQMSRKRIGDSYVRHAGYNEVGELNDIIILYPQVIATATNLQGCWDWFGYTGPLFATNSGFQPVAVKRMMDHLTG